NGLSGVVAMGDGRPYRFSQRPLAVRPLPAAIRKDRDQGDALLVQDGADLLSGAEAAIHEFSQGTHADAEHAAGKHGDHPSGRRPWMCFADARGGDQSRLADRERLLLDRLSMALEEIIVELAVALSGGFQVEQHDLRLVGLLRLRNESNHPFLEFVLLVL